MPFQKGHVSRLILPGKFRHEFYFLARKLILLPLLGPDLAMNETFFLPFLEADLFFLALFFLVFLLVVALFLFPLFLLGFFLGRRERDFATISRTIKARRGLFRHIVLRSLRLTFPFGNSLLKATTKT